MKTKQEITENWLPRYTGTQLNEFGEYILLTNFNHYLELFANGIRLKSKDITKQCRVPLPEK